MLLLLLVLVFVIVVVAWFIHKKKEIVALPHTVTGNRVKGYGMAAQLGFPTVNVKTTSKIPSGMWLADSIYGKAVILSLGYNLECHYLQWNDDIDRLQELRFYNLEKIKERTNSLIHAFNIGAEIISSQS
jgi:FAD synthase